MANDSKKPGTQIARPLTQFDKVRIALDGIGGSLMDALPKTMAKYLTPERVIKMSALEVGRSPALLKCTIPSILRAVVDAATLGLEIGSTIGQAYLVPYKNNKTGQMEAKLIVGYQGYISLASRSGTVAVVDVDCVREGDEYELLRGTETRLIHKPKMTGDIGDPIFYYCVAEMQNGAKSLTTMRLDEIEKVKKSSRARDSGPWKTWPEEMSKKTVIRRARKKWPFSVEMNHAASLENAAEGGGLSAIQMTEAMTKALEGAAAKAEGGTAPAAALPAGAPGDATDALLADMKEDAATVPAGREPPKGDAPGHPGQADWEGSDPGQAGSPPEAATGPENEPPKKPIDFTTLEQAAFDLGVKPEKFKQILEDAGVTSRTRSQDKFKAARDAIIQASREADAAAQPPGESGPAEAYTAPGIASVDDSGPPTAADISDDENKEPPKPISEDTAEEIRAMAKQHGLAANDEDLLNLLRWITGINTLAAVESLHTDQAIQVFNRFDTMITASKPDGGG